MLCGLVCVLLNEVDEFVVVVGANHERTLATGELSCHMEHLFNAEQPCCVAISA